jgi:hypothetical protein
MNDIYSENRIKRELEDIGHKPSNIKLVDMGRRGTFTENSKTFEFITWGANTFCNEHIEVRKSQK